jgi:hypothetical protein
VFLRRAPFGKIGRFCPQLTDPPNEELGIERFLHVLPQRNGPSCDDVRRGYRERGCTWTSEMTGSAHGSSSPANAEQAEGEQRRAEERE